MTKETSKQRREAHEKVIPYTGHNSDPVGTYDRYEQAAYWDFWEPSYNPAEEAHYAANPDHPANQIPKYSDKPF